ncbi:hypothetical protein HHK36_020347 [Tetracentron sinense]|uniref:Uncharacterized protein n=1 Tax=Tetracentron sinense TaxID=13715 RepID=A0A835D8R4_TETSI|nr:hypothetical protein HHK36_020347 [Tetracentron sinense]
MAKKSKKSRSKRVSLKKKYKVIRKAQKRKLGLLKDDDRTRLADTVSAKQNFVERETEVRISQEFLKVGQVILNLHARCVLDNTERAFYKELGRVIEASDVIWEVLDARDPLDLVPQEAVEKWLKNLREELAAVAVKCSTQGQRSNLG